MADTSTGTALASGTGAASDDAGAAGGRSLPDGSAVGGDMFSAVQLPLEAADISPDDDAADGSGAGSGLTATAAAVAATGAGVAARIGGGRGGAGAFTGDGGATFAIGGGVGTEPRSAGTGTRGVAGVGSGTFAIAGGVGTRGAVIDFGRGAFAGVGTEGRGLLPGSVGGRWSVCDPRGDAVGGAGGRNFGCGGIVCSGTGGAAAAGCEPGVIKRSSARSRSLSSDDPMVVGGSSPAEDLLSATRDLHCRSRFAALAM